MTHGFPELVIGGVLLAPFVPQAAIAFVLFLLCRPILRRLPLARIFANPPLISVCLYVVILATVMLFY